MPTTLAEREIEEEGRSAAMNQAFQGGFGRCWASCVLAVAAALSAGPALQAASGAEDKRPNILFALADDWSWPHAGIYGDKVVKVPVFEQVAAEGVLFTHVCSAAPSCSASRAAILTG